MRLATNRNMAILAALALIGGALLAYAYFIEPQRLVTNHSTLQIKKWNPAFNGLKIVMIGDVHGGSNGVTEEKIRQVVANANAENPDLIVLLGDYISERAGPRPIPDSYLKMPVETIGANLAGLRAKYGVFAVLGNHDGWFSDQRVSDALSGDGYRVLQNEVTTVTINGKPLRILGFKDHLSLKKSWQQVSDDAKALLLESGEGDTIALEHSPDIMPGITGKLSISDDLRLVLAAHTHGGQGWFPVFGRPIIPSSYGQKYAYGHVVENGVDLFVTSGVGTSVLPIRFMVPPEIVVLTINSAPPD